MPALRHGSADSWNVIPPATSVRQLRRVRKVRDRMNWVVYVVIVAVVLAAWVIAVKVLEKKS